MTPRAQARKTAPKTGDELLEEIQPTKRSADTWICLRGDLITDWEEENEKLGNMKAEELTGSAGRLASAQGGSAALKTQARKVQKLEAAIEAAQMYFRFENMDPDKHAELASQHPPRKGDQFDALTGYNREAMSKASVTECLVEPVFTEAGWARLMAVIPPGEWAELVQTCDRANGRVGQAPKIPTGGEPLARQERDNLKRAREWGVSPRVFDGWVPREVHEHQDAEGNRTGFTIIVRESEWDEATRERVERLAEYEQSLCPCGCGVSVDKAWDPFFEPWSVDSFTCYARKALESVRRQWEEQHKDGAKGYADGVEHYVVAAENAAHNDEAQAKADARRELRRRGASGN